MSFNLIDTYFIAKLGTIPLAAISFTFPVVLTLGSIAMGLGVGASSIVARAIGEKNYDKAQFYTVASLLLGLLFSIISAIFGILTIEPLFTLMGATPEVLNSIRKYMQIWYCGFSFSVLPMIGNFVIRATGNTIWPGLVLTISAGMNIILDPIFIFGLGNFPSLGMQGAALATVTGKGFSLIACLLILHFQEKLLCFKVSKIKDLISSWHDILRIAIPAGAANSINPISFGVVTSLMSAFGPNAIAAYGIGVRIKTFATIFMVALSTGIAPFVGQNWGAMEYNRVKRALVLGSYFCIFSGLILAFFIAQNSLWLVHWFSEDLDIVKIASRYLWIVPVSYGALGITWIVNHTLYALGRPLIGLTLLTLRTVVLYLPLAYVGRSFLGINGIFLATTFTDIAIGVLALNISSRYISSSSSESSLITSTAPLSKDD